MNKTVVRDIQNNTFIDFLNEERQSYNDENYSKSFYDFVNSIKSQVFLLQNDYIRTSMLLSVYRDERKKLKKNKKKKIQLNYYNNRIRDL